MAEHQEIDIDTSILEKEKIKVAIITSLWNHEITSELSKGCKRELIDMGILGDNISEFRVPGAFELPYGAKMMNTNQNPDAIVCLGCVIKGSTEHDYFINQAVSTALAQLGLVLSKPVVFGVLTTNTKEQAQERAGGSVGHKGVESARTALMLLAETKNTGSSGKKIGFHAD